MPISTCQPFLHQNKPSRESFFCGKVNAWRTKRALNMLNFTPKTRQNRLGCVHAQRQRKRKAGRLTTTSTSGCWACSSQPTATAACKRRRNRALADGFRLVKKTWKTFCQAAFWGATTLCHRETEQHFSDFIASLPSALRMYGIFILLLQNKEGKHLSVFRNAKRQSAIRPLTKCFMLFASLPVRLLFVCRHLARLIRPTQYATISRKNKQYAQQDTELAQALRFDLG